MTPDTKNGKPRNGTSRTGTIASITDYHDQTKHHYHRYARSPGYMDWSNQPDPFRTYAGAPRLALPFSASDPEADHMDLYRRQHPVSAPMALASVAAFLELSLGLSAWKQAGESRWALRMNPSSGNLHPTEAHLVLPGIDGVAAGVYHYAPLDHALERRAVLPDKVQDHIRAHFGTPGFLIALTSIFWREAWKYGERAFRYCNHDVGHAVAGLSFAARLQGWKVVCLNALADADIAAILGLNHCQWPRDEAEHPDLVCHVHRADTPDVPRDLPADLIAALENLVFTGRPNALSATPVHWKAIHEAARLTLKPRTLPQHVLVGASDNVPDDTAKTGRGPGAAAIIRQRRSATAFDRRGKISKKAFLSILDKTIARPGIAPFDAGVSAARIDLLLFVHNVESVPRGLYFYLRTPAHRDALKAALRPDFLWQTCDDVAPLFLLAPGDFRTEAITVSCTQEIAGFSAFSLGMIAPFEAQIQGAAWDYRNLFWECGMIGQVLYLEAEAHGVRGTGIGCFFDDAVHALLGIEGHQYQSLYHFTIGRPVEDHRISTHPAYFHLQPDAQQTYAGA